MQPLTIEKATKKQRDYIGKLLDNCDTDELIRYMFVLAITGQKPDSNLRNLSKSDASKIIKALLAFMADDDEDSPVIDNEDWFGN